VIEKYKSKKNRLHIIDSDHVPCLININTNIPKSHIFRFENYWLEHDQFMEVVAHGWYSCSATRCSKILTYLLGNFGGIQRPIFGGMEFQVAATGKI
jgi:hypothetical protein